MSLTSASMLIAGAKHHWIAFRDTNGYPKGNLITPDSPSVNTLYGAYRRPTGFVSNAGATIERSIATLKEGQQEQAKVDLGVASISTFDAVFGAYDETYNGLVSGDAVDLATVDNWAETGVQSGDAVLPSVFACWTSLATVVGGGTFYINLIYQNVQIAPPSIAVGQGDGENPNPLTYTVTPSNSSRHVTGRVLGSTSTKRLYTVIRSAKPLYSATFIGNNAATTCTLPYLPTSSTADGDDANSITVAGATLAVTSVNTSTGVVTFASAPASGAIVVFLYQTEYDTP